MIALRTSIVNKFIDAYSGETHQDFVDLVLSSAKEKTTPTKKQLIVDFISNNPGCTSRDIPVNYAPMYISDLIYSGQVEVCGKKYIKGRPLNMLRIKQ